LIETGINSEDNLEGKQLEELIQNGLKELWQARSYYHEDPEVNKLTVYLREDRSRAGELKREELAPNVAISDRNGISVLTHEYYNSLQKDKIEGRYLFVIAGSVS